MDHAMARVMDMDEGDTADPSWRAALQAIQRDINCLAEDALGVRVSSLQKLERVLVKQIESLPTDTVDLVAEATLKPLLKRMKDKSEKCREMAVRDRKSVV